MNAKKKKREEGKAFIIDDTQLVNYACAEDEYQENLDDILAELLFES